jgi:hypothetical protein
MYHNTETNATVGSLAAIASLEAKDNAATPPPGWITLYDDDRQQVRCISITALSTAHAYAAYEARFFCQPMSHSVPRSRWLR